MANRITNEDLAHLVGKWESISFECKETLNREIKEKLSTYFAAFANTEGGLFAIGINDAKETVGYSFKKGEREYISQQAESCHPPVYIDIDEREYDNNKIILIDAPKSKIIHTDKNYRFPVRVGSNLAYLDITGLIQLSKERLGLIYGTDEPEILIDRFYRGTKVRGKATPEDIELCLNAIGGATKEVRLEGLKELELIIYDNDIFYEPRVFEVFGALLNDADAEIRRKALEIIELMIIVAENDEFIKKRIEQSNLHVINLAKNDPNPEVRSEAIKVLAKIEDEQVIEIITAIVLNESDENYNKLKYSFIGREMGSSIKRQLKSVMLKELGDSKWHEIIRKRIREVIEESRRTTTY